jgi:D-alanine transaminase
MPKIAYVNGHYLSHVHAGIHIEDRGFQFADGVYEVILVRDKNFVDIEQHLDRLNRSLSELDIHWPTTRRAFKVILREVIVRNRITNGSIYLQITRGSADRNFTYPAGLVPSLIIYARRAPRDTVGSAIKGGKVVSKPDIRWKRCDIKSVSLLPAILAKQAAMNEGAMEAWLVDEDGMVTEGTSSNAWIVTANKELVTRPIDNSILSGITRQTVRNLSESAGILFVERLFSLEDAKNAKEAFCTSSTALVKPVFAIDGVQIGDGIVGPITQLLIEYYLNHMDTQL